MTDRPNPPGPSTDPRPAGLPSGGVPPGGPLSEIPARRGFFVNVGSLVFARGFLAVSQVLVLPIVARYLTIEEFGLMALAMTVVIFASSLSDAGLGRSLIRSRGMDLEEWSSVFWLLVGVGIGLALLVLALAPLWAWFFDQPELWLIVSVLAVVPLFQAISAAPNAEIERREHYTALARLQMLAAAAGMVIAVGLAVAGAGVWALVAQQILLAAIRLAGVARLSQFRPRLVFRLRRLAGHLRFARDAVWISLISVAQVEAATVAIGKLLGEAPLGVFAMSRRFTRLPQFGLVGPFSSVVYVRMAKAQDDPEQLVAIYLASIRLLAAALIPPLALVAAAGSAVFVFLLSEDWAGVAPVFALAVPGIVLEAVTITCLACLFRATGRTELQVRLRLEGALVQIALVTLAAFHSLEAVAASLTLWALYFVPRGWALARRIVPLGWGACLGAIARPVAMATAASAAHLAFRPMLPPGALPEIVLAIVLAIAALGAMAALDWRRLRAAVALFR